MVDDIKQLITTSAMLLSALVNVSTCPAQNHPVLLSHTALAKPASKISVKYTGNALSTLNQNLICGEPASGKSKTVRPKNLSARESASAASQIFYQDSCRITASERDLIERVVMTSCGTLNNFKMAVANTQVIRDRLESGKFGKTIRDVLLAPLQFETPWKGQVNTIVKEAVSAVFDKNERIISRPVYYYVNPHDSVVLASTWSKNKIYVTTIGTGRFIHQYWTSKQ